MLYLFGQVLVFVLIALVLGAALAWIFLIGPMRRQRASAAVPATNPEDRPPAATAAEAGGQAGQPSRGGLQELDEDRLAALTDWLRRQEERSTVENAELVTRLAAAERQAGESEHRVSAAERQVAAAVEQVGAAQDRIAQIEAELRGVAADEQGRESRRLRTALAEAEARAARFSARLAIVRTEVEEAAHQASTVTERLDRRQAEWAAERADLLVRIAEAESIAGAWAAHHEGGEIAARTMPARQRTPVAAALVPAGSAAGPGAGGPDGTEPPAVDTAALDAVVQEILDADADARAVPGADREVAAPTPPAEPVVVPEPGPADTPVALEPVAAEPVSAKTVDVDGVDDPRPVDAPAPRHGLDADEPVVPSWGGPAEPVPSTDNLREIVGIGPVIETRLRALGITSFRQLAAMGDTDVDRLSARLDGFGSRILSDDWVGQARELQTRGHEDLGY